MAEPTFRIADDRSGDIKRVTLAEFDHWKRAGYRVLDPLSYDNAVAAAEGRDAHPVAPPMTEMQRQAQADAAAVSLAALEAAGGTIDESSPDVVAARKAMADTDYEGRVDAELGLTGIEMTADEAAQVREQLMALRQAGETRLPSAEGVLAGIRGE